MEDVAEGIVGEQLDGRLGPLTEHGKGLQEKRGEGEGVCVEKGRGGRRAPAARSEGRDGLFRFF